LSTGGLRSTSRGGLGRLKRRNDVGASVGRHVEDRVDGEWEQS
jgi:hypothetical protein